jgi:hypothetical protein
VQQPWGHEAASHTHCPPPLHSWPEGHEAHEAPLEPHDELDSPDGNSHVSPAVQHPGHDVPAQVQAPSEHASPFAQAAHDPPPVPHSPADWDETATHAPDAAQQPPGHEVASQVHCPVLVSHSCPERQAPQLAPPTPHCGFDWEACATHWPFSVQHPPAHVLGPQPPATSGGPSFVVWSEGAPS